MSAFIVGVSSNRDTSTAQALACWKTPNAGQPVVAGNTLLAFLSWQGGTAAADFSDSGVNTDWRKGTVRKHPTREMYGCWGWHWNIASEASRTLMFGQLDVARPNRTLTVYEVTGLPTASNPFVAEGWGSLTAGTSLAQTSPGTTITPGGSGLVVEGIATWAKASVTPTGGFTLGITDNWGSCAHQVVADSTPVSPTATLGASDDAIIVTAAFTDGSSAPPSVADTLDLYVDSTTIANNQEVLVSGRYRSNGAAANIAASLKDAVTAALLAMVVVTAPGSAAPSVPGYTARTNARYFAPAGNDSTGDGSSGNPWHSLHAKLQAGVIPDDCEIVLKNGTYSLTTVVADSYSGAYPRRPTNITIRSESFQQAIVKNSGATIASPFVMSDWSDWEIHGLDLEDWFWAPPSWPSDGGGAPITVMGDSARWRIVGNKLRNNGSTDTNQELMHSFYISTGVTFATAPRNFLIAHNDIDGPSGARNGAGLAMFWHGDGVGAHDGLIEWNKLRGKWTYGVMFGANYTAESVGITVRHNDMNAAFSNAAVFFATSPGGGGVDATCLVRSNILANTQSTGKSITRQSASRAHAPTVRGNYYYLSGAANAAACLSGITVDTSNVYKDPSTISANSTGTFTARVNPPPGTFTSQASGDAGAAVAGPVVGQTVTMPGVAGVGYMPTDFDASSISLGADIQTTVGASPTLQVVDNNGWRRAGVTLVSSDPTILTWPGATANGSTTTSDTLGKATPTLLRAGTVTVTATLGGLSDQMVVTVGAPAVAADTTPPTVSLQASSQTVASAGSVRLTANATDDRGVVRVRFFKDGVQLGADITGAGPYVVDVSFTGTPDNGTFAFTAQAWDAAGNTRTSDAVTVTVAIPLPIVTPAAPSGLTLVTATSSSLALRFTDNATTETGFAVERREGNGSFVALPQLAAHSGTGAVDFTDSGLKANTSYTYRVRAIGADASSGWSQEYGASTLVSTAAGALATLYASTADMSGAQLSTAPLVLTALDSNGASKPGVSVTPSFSVPGVASITPAAQVTAADGKAVFSVRFDALGTTQLTFVATDGATTLGTHPGETPVVTVAALPQLTDSQITRLLAEPADPKYAEEMHPYVIEFEGLDSTEQLNAIESVSILLAGNTVADPTDQTMLVGPARIYGKYAVVWVRGGDPGFSYYVRVHANTSIGRLITGETRVRIFATPGRRA